MRQTGRAYRIMEMRQSYPFQTLSLGRMDIIRIIEITDTGRLAKELRKEGWTPDSDETGRWRKDGTVFRLTDSGFHAYIGPDGQCPPTSDIDMLEPVDHGIQEIPGKGDSESHACALLARAAYQNLMRDDPIPARVRASDLTAMEDHIDRTWRVMDEMKGLSSDPSASEWDGLIRRLENRLGIMERRQRSENREIIRTIQLFAGAAVAADLAQYALAFSQASPGQMLVSLIVFIVFAGLGALLVFHWHPED